MIYFCSCMMCSNRSKVIHVVCSLRPSKPPRPKGKRRQQRRPHLQALALESSFKEEKKLLVLQNSDKPLAIPKTLRYPASTHEKLQASKYNMHTQSSESPTRSLQRRQNIKWSKWKQPWSKWLRRLSGVSSQLETVGCMMHGSLSVPDFACWRLCCGLTG